MTGDASPKRSGPPGWLCWVPLASLLAAELYVRDYDGWGAWASAPLLFVPGLIALPLVVLGLLDCATAVRRHEPVRGSLFFTGVAALPICWLSVRRLVV